MSPSIPSRTLARLASGLLLLLTGGTLVVTAPAAAPEPFLRSEIIFPPEGWHNHGSCIIETPRRDLLVCWFHGSGERKADDVIIEGARLRKGSRTWSPRFTMSDTPGYSDGNPCLFIDPQKRLWLLHTTILAHTWESALLKRRISRDYDRDGSPRWESSEVIHVTPEPEFDATVGRELPRLADAAATMNLNERQRHEVDAYLDAMRHNTTNELYRRLGWMTRAHPFVLDAKRLIVPLYHDGFSFSLMAISDDWGATWHTSTPLIGGGNIQPAIALRRDGSLYAAMRDNGPPPARVLQADSRDRGETWGPVTDSEIPNPGAGTEVITLKNGDWLFIGNDLERGRHSLAVLLSDDEGRSWKWRRHLERRETGQGSFHYPSIIESADGTFHASYSHFETVGGKDAKTIKHAHFNRAWLMQGDDAR